MKSIGRGGILGALKEESGEKGYKLRGCLGEIRADVCSDFPDGSRFVTDVPFWKVEMATVSLSLFPSFYPPHTLPAYV